MRALAGGTRVSLSVTRCGVRCAVAEERGVMAGSLEGGGCEEGL